MAIRDLTSAAARQGRQDQSTVLRRPAASLRAPGDRGPAGRDRLRDPRVRPADRQSSRVRRGRVLRLRAANGHMGASSGVVKPNEIVEIAWKDDYHVHRRHRHRDVPQAVRPGPGGATPSVFLRGTEKEVRARLYPLLRQELSRLQEGQLPRSASPDDEGGRQYAALLQRLLSPGLIMDDGRRVIAPPKGVETSCPVTTSTSTSTRIVRSPEKTQRFAIR